MRNRHRRVASNSFLCFLMLPLLLLVSVFLLLQSEPANAFSPNPSSRGHPRLRRHLTAATLHDVRRKKTFVLAAVGPERLHSTSSLPVNHPRDEEDATTGGVVVRGRNAAMQSWSRKKPASILSCERKTPFRRGGMRACYALWKRVIPTLGVLFWLPLRSAASSGGAAALSAAGAAVTSISPPIPASSEFRLTLRLVTAAILGAALGKERSIAKHSAGVRTMALVAMGAAAYTVCSVYGFSVVVCGDGSRYDPGRMASQVASGVGFVGAGVITSTSHLNGRNIVHGLTTAATIWLSAAVGVACGTGLYQVAAAAAALTVFILRLGRIQPKPPGASGNGNKGGGNLPPRLIVPQMAASDWQHHHHVVEMDDEDDDGDSYAETHDTSEWDEHPAMHTTMLNDALLGKEIDRTDMDAVIAGRRSPPQQAVAHASAGAEALVAGGRGAMSAGTEHEIVVDKDPKLEKIMHKAWQHHAAYQKLRIKTVPKFADDPVVNQNETISP